jgi:hypothetical protein
MRGLRSGLDKIYLVVLNEEMANSVIGKIEWLVSKDTANLKEEEVKEKAN